MSKKPLTIWFFIGLILILYGLLIGGAGIYYVYKPYQSVALFALNPSLWWGFFLFVAGLIFVFINQRVAKKFPGAARAPGN